MQRQSSAWTVALIHRLTFNVYLIIILHDSIIGFEVANDLVRHEIQCASRSDPNANEYDPVS